MHGIRGEFASAREAEAYFEGAADALRLFAWWRDGTQYVGTTGTTLSLALDELDAARRLALKLEADLEEVEEPDAKKPTRKKGKG